MVPQVRLRQELGCSLCRDKNNIPLMLRNDFPVESVNVLKVSANMNALQVKFEILNAHLLLFSQNGWRW